MSDPDFPKDWDDLYDQLYVLKEKGVDQPFLPHWMGSADPATYQQL